MVCAEYHFIYFKKKKSIPFATHIQQEYIEASVFLLHLGEYILYTQAVL